MKAKALYGRTGAHDPCGIVKCDDTYWIFTTGRGPYAMYSEDLVNWNQGQTPLTPGAFPPWVTNYVPDFGGDFWAPDCMHMNGKYYLYYSCSSWGSTVSCIGLLTTESLNPGSEGYAWKDEGLVVNSTVSSNYNCIDPAVSRDKEGRIWLSYGSHWDGIRMVELDSVTGLVIGETTYSVAGKGDYKTEASYVIDHGEFYYLFYNRGQCCDGVNSTYYIQMGRSTSPYGPFLDKNGKDCYKEGGGTTIMSTAYNRIGPGCIGYYVEGNREYVTYHYYDGDRRGRATLGIGTFKWSEDGWPSFSNDWIGDGTYSIVNANSLLAWDISGTGADGDFLIQNTYTHAASQKWTFQSMGNACYQVYAGGKELVAGLNPCTASPGTGIALGTGSTDCQIWLVEKTGSGSYVISSQYTNRAIEIPGSSTDEAAPIEINDYSGGKNQKWMISDTSFAAGAEKQMEEITGLLIYPNPVTGNSFRILIDRDGQAEAIEVGIFSATGGCVYRETIEEGRNVEIEHGLQAGTYIVRVIAKDKIFFKKLIIQRYY